MSASLDSRDEGYTYIGYVFVDLAPNGGIGDVAKRGPFDTGNKVPACASYDYDLVLSILSDPVKGVDSFSMILCGESKGSAFGVKFCYQYPAGISCELQTTICVEIVSFTWVHRNLLVVSSLNRMNLLNLPFANQIVKCRNSMRVSAGSRRIV